MGLEYQEQLWEMGGTQSGEKEESFPLFWGSLLTLTNSLTEG